MGKIGIVYMGNIDASQKSQNSDSRTEEEGLYPHSDSRGSGNARRQSSGTGDQQKRTNRANSSEPSFLGTRTTVTGEILTQLISVYRDQLVAKEEELQRLQHLQNEILSIRSRIQECEALQNELEVKIEET